MITIKNFTNEELRARDRFLSRSIPPPPPFFCFFSKVCEFDKLCTRKEDSFTSLGLRHLSLLLVLQPCVTVIGVQCLCLWFFTLIVNLLCETGKFSSTFLVKIEISEALK